jgi:hypothetical protein
MILLTCLDLRDPQAFYDEWGNRYLVTNPSRFLQLHNQLLMQALLSFR